jgi:hypothetical protein
MKDLGERALMKFSTMAERAGFHDFQVSGADRRQYPRLSLTFPMWWLSGEIGGVEGIAIEISASGIRFLLKRELPKRECSIAFQINDRKMWAKVSIVRTTQAMHENQCWNCYGANFEGLLESDFDFIVVLSYGGLTPHSEAGRADSPAPALGEAPLATSTVSISSLQSHERLMPDVAREQIVQMLVAMDRLEAVENMYFAPIGIHYVGICRPAEADVLYHQYAVRTRKNTVDGRVVYNTHFLLSDDGLTIRFAHIE